jgi:hypothetical protein
VPEGLPLWPMVLVLVVLQAAQATLVAFILVQVAAIRWAWSRG